jgi:hypothetical protein
MLIHELTLKRKAKMDAVVRRAKNVAYAYVCSRDITVDD